MISVDWAKKILPILNLNKNPERQFRKIDPRNPHGGDCYFENYLGCQLPHQKIIADIGRDWLRKNKLRRNRGGPHTFIHWI